MNAKLIKNVERGIIGAEADTDSLLAILNNSPEMSSDDAMAFVRMASRWEYSLTLFPEWMDTAEQWNATRP